MGRKTIAPVLKLFVERHDGDAPAWVEGARRELRALVAVARAAEAWNPLHGHEAQGSPGTEEDCAGCRLDRALSRLERVSKEE